MNRKSQWGSRWSLGGDFNDIRNNEEKKGGRHRQKNSFYDFRNFIFEMQMGKIKFKGQTFTWKVRFYSRTFRQILWLS